ncbi:MAG: hypothetical protein AABZ47_06165 [Planctomycetota bacterium]
MISVLKTLLIAALVMNILIALVGHSATVTIREAGFWSCNKTTRTTITARPIFRGDIMRCFTTGKDVGMAVLASLKSLVAIRLFVREFPFSTRLIEARKEFAVVPPQSDFLKISLVLVDVRRNQRSWEIFKQKSNLGENQ